MAYNKVIKKDGTVMLDLTNTTVSIETLAKNITAVDKYGNKIIGTLTDSPLPIEVSTEEEMNTLLESGEVGSIYKYTGTTGTYENGALYELTEETDQLKGTWVFNDTLTFSENNFLVNMEFVSNDFNYSKILIAGTSAPSNSQKSIMYIPAPGLPRDVFRSDDWIEEAYKTIYISSLYNDLTVGTGADGTVEDFFSWLQVNATKQPSRTFEKLVIQIGTLDITTNGEYDVTEYANANIDIINTLQYVMDNNGDTPTCQYLFSYWQGTDPTLSFTGVDTSNVTDMSYMFFHCPNLTTIPLLDTSNVTNMSYMFEECTNLTTIPLLDTSNVTNMENMFYECSNLTSIPQLDTSSVINMGHMFKQCTNLTSIPQFDTSKVISMYGMFDSCNNLTTIPQLDTSNVTSMGSMFYNCTNLTTIPPLDTSKVSGLYWMFTGCTNLKTILMYGMKTSFNISASTQFETDDLVTILNNLATVSSATLTMGETNLAKLSDEQKQIAIDKGWTLE